MTSLDDTFHAAPLHDRLQEGIEASGLTVHRIADEDREQAGRWLDAVSRGFLDSERNDMQREAFFTHSAYRRKLGVYDPAAPEPEVPVATFASWGTELTVPGGVVPACAISSVTVSPTHRRRGILRTLMAGELHTAAAEGYPVAVLTVSESGIYGRFGFAPAASAASWEIDVVRAGWTGPDAPGRIDFVSRAHGREVAPALHDRIRPTSPGEIAMPGGHWERFFGTRPDVEKAEERRVIQYTSPEGEVDGLAIYKVKTAEDFARSSADVLFLLAATDAAYAALWRFLLSMDLIATVRAEELAVDEPLWWMLADQRAATITMRDHQYVRILDVPTALAARRYDVTDTVVLEVLDPLGVAGGVFVLSADGTASVDAVDDPPVGLPLLRAGVAELSAMLLGGVSPVTLARAGRLTADDPERFARLFGTASAPRLSFWY